VKDALSLIEGFFGDSLSLGIEMVVELLQVDQRHLGGFLDLADDFLSEIVEMLFGIHEFLEVDHRVKVSNDKELVLASSNIHVNLVHGDILSVATVGVLLHLGVVVLHGISGDSEREGSSFLYMVQEVPGGRRVGIFLLTEALHFGGLEHVMKLVIVWVFGTLIVVHFKHS